MSDPGEVAELLKLIGILLLIGPAVSYALYFLTRWLVLAPPALLSRLYALFRRRPTPKARHAHRAGLPDVQDVIDGAEQTRAIDPAKLLADIRK